ncbi:MAG: nucleotidyl transferase AbiEii/AbiGii toxin family protein [Kangiellaceae bacterium]|nr:nucleotidyl transferase AbiEii/AbiGii toxin family protein [Kangiellaceae bacterium]
MLLNNLVSKALKNNPDAIGLNDVVEKEILHHDIMTVLHREGLLRELTFIGGTALRLCYNSSRLSEDLDFTAGVEFDPASLSGLPDELEQYLSSKYELKVKVRGPNKNESNTSTWKITIEKFSDRPDLPSQKLHVDVCSLPSYEVEGRPLIEHYGLMSPLRGLPIPVQSKVEILADKMVAFAYRERRIKPRDVWDIAWLKQQGVNPSPELILRKLDDRDKKLEEFLDKITKHSELVENSVETKLDFMQEMERFLPMKVADNTIKQKAFWQYLSTTISDEVNYIKNNIKKPRQITPFKMKM